MTALTQSSGRHIAYRRPSKDRIEMTCPTCAETVVVPLDWAGGTTKCSVCRLQIRIPLRAGDLRQPDKDRGSASRSDGGFDPEARACGQLRGDGHEDCGPHPRDREFRGPLEEETTHRAREPESRERESRGRQVNLKAEDRKVHVGVRPDPGRKRTSVGGELPAERFDALKPSERGAPDRRLVAEGSAGKDGDEVILLKGAADGSRIIR